VPYLDTSILGSYYCPEALSTAVNSAVASISEAVISPLVEVEFCSLLSLKVRTGALNRPAASAALSQFRIHVADGLYLLVDTSPREYALARDWLARFDTPLRMLDALHLATAVAHRQEVFTTDKTLAKSAQQVGAKCRIIR
jgi:uncharacterized protein